MKRFLIVSALMLAAGAATMVIGAASAMAADIAGKWGVSAGLFTTGGEVSLIRGHSDRTAWLLDLSVIQRETSTKVHDTGSITSDSQRNTNSGRVSFGPRIRRFTRPDADFSPYWDVFVHGTYQRNHDSLSGFEIDQELSGVDGGFAFGLEYATPWHCSIAAHSGLASLSWLHIWSRASNPIGESKTKGHDQVATLGISPALYLRAYF